MEQQYRSIKEIAEEWGVTPRRVQMLCTAGKLAGAKKISNVWMVPADVERPIDNRVVTGAHIKVNSNTNARLVQIKNKEARELNRQIVSLLSHDIRTSLNNILGASEMIAARKEDGVSPEAHIKKIQESSHSILALTDNLIEMANLLNGEAVCNEELCDLEDVIASIAQEDIGNASRRDVQIQTEVNVAHNLIYMDKEKIAKILRNVIEHSVAYSKDHGMVRVIVEEKYSRKEGYVKIVYSIEDHGVGMTPQAMSQIYNIFKNEIGENERRTDRLGMAIVKQLVELLDGDIQIESHSGFGTKFKIGIKHRVAQKDETLTSVQKATMEEFKGKRILLAEDNEMNCEIAKEVLEDAGFLVECVKDGILCVAKLETSPIGYFDYILMDLVMPNMDGFSATKVIRSLPHAAHAKIPVVAMTASVMEKDRQRAIAAGMNGFVEKPFKLPLLLETLKRCE